MWLLGAVRLTLTGAAVAYLVAFVVYFGVLAMGRGGAGWLGFVRELTLYLFLPLPALLLAAIVCRARLALLSLALPLVVFLAYYGPRFGFQPSPAAGASGSFRVISFNTGANAGGGSLAPLLRTLRAVDADVVALQEVPSATLDQLRIELAAAYPYQEGTVDAASFSRFPLQRGPELQLGDSPYVGQQLSLSVRGRPVVLTNVHVTRPVYRLQWRRQVVPVLRGYNAESRDAQVTELVNRIRAVPGARLLTGDFNETEWSRPYQLLAAELGDSYREAGRGFGHTYPSNFIWGDWRFSLPLMRIDYVFHSRDLVALEARVGPDGGSDHLPVVAELSFQ